MAKAGKSGKGLSDAFCRTVTEPGRYTDERGLMLIVAKRSKRWGQRIVIQEKRCDLGLGGYPRVSLAEAREVAKRNHEIARTGGDPRSGRRAAEEAATVGLVTFEEVARAALEVKLASLSNGKHRQQWQNTLATYAYPKIGRKRVTDISPADVVVVLKPIWRTKTETASRLQNRIEYVLDYASAHGLRSGDNPARWKGNLEFHLPPASKVATVRHHPALQLEHAGEWFKAVKRRKGMAARALEFLALTAARSGEVRGATWDEVDLNRGIWTVPAGRMKAGREHRVPLSREALDLLGKIDRLDGNPLIFFAPRGGALSDMSISAVMRRVQTAETHDGAAGFVDKASGRAAVPHGLRSTFRQWCAEEGYDRDLAEMALAHRVGNDVERAYQRSDVLERRRAMQQAWADFLSTSANPWAPGLTKEHLVMQRQLRSVG